MRFERSFLFVDDFCDFHICLKCFLHLLVIILHILAILGAYYVFRGRPTRRPLASSPSMPVFDLGTRRPRFGPPGSRLDVASGESRVDPEMGQSLVSSGRDPEARERGRRAPRPKTGKRGVDAYNRLLGGRPPEKKRTSNSNNNKNTSGSNSPGAMH